MTDRVAIIGGGPAGTVAALELAKAGSAVIVIERDASDGWKIGEGLPPAAKPILQRLGLWDRFLADEHLASYGNCSAWGSSELVDHSFVFNPHGCGWHVDRRRFDRMLLDAATEAGAKLVSGFGLTTCWQVGSSWWLQGKKVFQELPEPFTAEAQRTLSKRRDSSQTLCDPSAMLRDSAVEKADSESLFSSDSVSIEADFVIDASGRGSWFARRQGAKRIRHDNLVGLAVLLKAESETDQDSLTLVEAVAEGWWYAALLPCKKLVAVFLSDADLESTGMARTAEGWKILLDQTLYLRKRIERHGYRIETEPKIVSANSSHLDLMAGESWLAAGDAAAAFDPLSSQGIITAMESGILAAEAILSGQLEALKSYSQRLEQVFTAYLANRNFYYSQEKRWPDSTFWLRRHVPTI